MWENFIFTYFPRKLFWRVPCRKKRTSGLSILRQSWLCFWPLISNSNCLQAELQSKICEESVVDFFYEIRLGHQHNSVSAFWSRSPSRISGHTIKSLTTVICWADWDRNFFFFFFSSSSLPENVSGVGKAEPVPAVWGGCCSLLQPNPNSPWECWTLSEESL